jgi:hypothetical protein
MSGHEHPDCPVALHYRAVWREWSADPENKRLWARVNAALDGLEAQPPPDGSCPCTPSPALAVRAGTDDEEQQ